MLQSRARPILHHHRSSLSITNAIGGLRRVEARCTDRHSPRHSTSVTCVRSSFIPHAPPTDVTRGSLEHFFMAKASRAADSSAVVPPAADTAEVHPGVATASDHGADDLADAGVPQAAPTPRRLRMLPMEGRWGEWFMSTISRSDENEMNGEKPEEGRENEGMITPADADDYYVSDYYGNPSHLEHSENTGMRNDGVGERPEHRGDEEERLKRLGARHNNDADDDMFGEVARSGYHHSRVGGRIVPGRGRGRGQDVGDIAAKGERPEPRKHDGPVGSSSKGSSDATERSLDAGKYDFLGLTRGSDTTVDAREDHGGQQVTDEAEEEWTDWSADDLGAVHHAPTTRVPISNPRPAPGALPAPHDQLDERDGLWAAGGGEDRLDSDGGTRREQGILATNLFLKPTAVPRKESPPAEEADEVPQSRRRFRRPDENWENDNEMASSAWSQSADDEYATGTWDTDDDFFIHVAHYSRATKGNQHGTLAAVEPAWRRRQWERARESLWDTDDDFWSHEEEAYHRLEGPPEDDAVDDMPAAAAAAANKEARRTWESWVTDESDDLSLYDVPGAPSTPSETDQKQTGSSEAADKYLVEWQFKDDLEYYDRHASLTSADWDGEQGPGVTDDWGVDGGTYYFAEDPVVAATKDGHGGHARAAEEEEEVDEEKGFVAPYSEYYSYLAEMKQLRRQESSFARFSADLQQELHPPPRGQRMKAATSDAAVDAEQRERPPEEQEKEWGHLGLLIKPLLDLFSAGERGGALGFLEGLLPPSNSRDDPSKTRQAPNQERTPTNLYGGTAQA